MHQVVAHGVAPVHVAPVPAIRVVLVEQVIFTFVVHQSIGIVEPSAARREMELGPVRLSVRCRTRLTHCTDRLVLRYRVQCFRFAWQDDFNIEALSMKPVDLAKGPKIGFDTIRQFNFKFANYSLIHAKPHLSLRCACLDRQMHVAVFDDQLSALQSRLALRAAVYDLIDIAVAPTPFSHVHDLDGRCEAREFGNGPSVPMKLFATAGLIVWPGSRAYHLPINNKIDTSFAGIL